jgi:hypothetical protein
MAVGAIVTVFLVPDTRRENKTMSLEETPGMERLTPAARKLVDFLRAL